MLLGCPVTKSFPLSFINLVFCRPNFYPSFVIPKPHCCLWLPLFHMENERLNKKLFTWKLGLQKCILLFAFSPFHSQSIFLTCQTCLLITCFTSHSCFLFSPSDCIIATPGSCSLSFLLAQSGFILQFPPPPGDVQTNFQNTQSSSGLILSTCFCLNCPPDTYM